MSADDYRRFSDLGFEDFRRMAKDSSLSRYEKIGFPNSYREGKEELIFRDIVTKLPGLQEKNKVVLDIGPGCSDLPRMLIDLCKRNSHSLLLVDSQEMLSNLPDDESVTKIGGYFPQCERLFADFAGKVDAIVAYSLLHYVFVESNVWGFLDRCLELLNHGGKLLIGDIPNVSKRRRFFSSPLGVKFHQDFTSSDSLPDVQFNRIERQSIDDAVVLGLIARARSQGYDAYVLPQPPDLPMANRREDILIERP